MKKYNTPEIEVIELANEDVITLSTGRGDDIEGDIVDW